VYKKLVGCNKSAGQFKLWIVQIYVKYYTYFEIICEVALNIHCLGNTDPQIFIPALIVLVYVYDHHILLMGIMLLSLLSSRLGTL